MICQRPIRSSPLPAVLVYMAQCAGYADWVSGPFGRLDIYQNNNLVGYNIDGSDLIALAANVFMY
jgi:hypothetical protein